jgi:formylglycine-generating enzyme required for sulfatase activity
MTLHIPPTLALPAGAFTMGLPPCPAGAALARRWHSGQAVAVAAFALGQFPVTNAEYRDYVQTAAADAPRSLTLPGLDADTQPVGGVSWLDAARYCAWLSAETGRNYRLPTDAEWEYAARGGRAGQAFPWGDALDPAGAWYGGQPATRPVGSYPPNGYGLHDLIGNVWEWCADTFQDVSAGVPATNAPTGKDLRLNRVLRGGSYLTQDPLNLWIAYRHEDPPDLRHECIGFRVALDLASG